jgi:MATE family multidrug resistance protein
MHKKVWALAGPIMLANITTPLLGAVDIAVVGHLPGAENIAAVGIGATIFSALYFGFVFLRMGTTGLVAIEHGSGHELERSAWLLRSIIIAIVIGTLLYILHPLISAASIYFINPLPEVAEYTSQYFNTRILSAPAALCNFAILGFMIGMQHSKLALVVQLVLNVTNIILDIYFVVGLNLGVKGVAFATVIAEYVGLITGIFVIRKDLNIKYHYSYWIILFNIKKLRQLCSVNGNIFVRSLCLQIAFFLFTAKSTVFGSAILAANIVLMNFQMFLSYALDGFANAAESLTGESLGKKQIGRFYETVKSTLFWALVVSILFSIVYILFWSPIVNLLTDITEVRTIASDYIIWMWVLPLLSVGSFYLDGVFTGAATTKPMRNSMILSLFIFIVATNIFIPLWQNHGLWLAFCVFMLARAVSLGLAWPKLLEKFQ